MSIFDQFSDEDKKTGIMLSRLVKPVNAASNCPPPEDIAAFIDNQLPRRKRKLVMAHVNSCENCQQLYIETIETLNDIRGGKRKARMGNILTFSSIRQKRSVYRTAVSLSAIAAAALVMFFFVNWQPSLPSAIDMVRRLSTEENLTQWTLDSRIDESAEFQNLSAFEKPQELIAFSIGKTFAKIEFARLVRDHQRTAELLNELLINLRSLPVPPELQAKFQSEYQRYQSQTGKLPEDPTYHAQNYQQLIDFLEGVDLNRMFRFGEWVMLGFYASDNKNQIYFRQFVKKSMGLFQPNTISYWINYGKNKGWLDNGEIMVSLRNINNTIQKTSIDSTDFSILKQAYFRILQHLH